MFQTEKKLRGLITPSSPPPPFGNSPLVYRACTLVRVRPFRVGFTPSSKRRLQVVAGLPEPPSSRSLDRIMIPGARLATYFIANFSFHGWMKWPEAGRRPSKRERGRDKLNEPKEKTRPSLLSYTLERAETFSIKELREKRKKKKEREREREKDEESGEKEGRRGWKE